MKNKLTKLVALLLVFATLLTVAATPAINVQAASVNKVTANKNYKKAPSLKKGDNKITCKKIKESYHYSKFKAPAAGTYEFTFSNMGAAKDIGAYGFICLKSLSSYGTFDTLKVTTNKGKKTGYLKMASNYYWNNYDKQKWTGEADQYNKTRTAKLKLKKNQVIYLYSYCTSEPYSFTAKIKKVK